MLAEVRTTKVAERSAAFFVPTRVWLDATKVMRRSKRKGHLSVRLRSSVLLGL